MLFVFLTQFEKTVYTLSWITEKCTLFCMNHDYLIKMYEILLQTFF